MVFYEYSVVADYNNAANLMNIETLFDASNKKFEVVSGHPAYEPGSERTLSNGLPDWQGYPHTQWISGVMHWSGYLYLYTTILNNSYANYVTMRTRTKGGAYSNFNAILKIPTEIQLINVNRGQAHPRFVWTYTRMVAI